MKWNGSIELNSDGSGQILNAYVEKLAAAPTVDHSVQEGRLFFNTTTNQFNYSNGSAWAIIPSTSVTDAIQTELNSVESALGSIVGADGAFNSSALTGVPIISAATSVTNALTLLANNAASGGGASELSDLTDVEFTALSATQFMQYDGADWVNHTLVLGDVTDISASAAEVNILNGATITTTELNYLDGVTSAVQTQLDAKQPLDATLTALAAHNTNGILVQTAADSFEARTLTAPAAGITVSNGNGVSGNPTLALADDLAALEGLATTGIIVRTGTNTAATRELEVSERLTIENEAGISGNPSIDLAEVTLEDSGTFLKVTVDDYGRVSGTTAVVADDITDLVDDTYVNADGDTMSGDLVFSNDATVKGVPTPEEDSDVANKAYVDTAIESLPWKNSVKVASTANIDLSSDLEAGTTYNGVTLGADDRVLVKDQDDATENGIYIVTAGAAVRASDMDTASEFNGAVVFVEDGSTDADTLWVQASTVNNLGTDTIQFVQLNTGGGGTYSAGTGLTLVADTTFNVNLGAGISENPSDSVGIDLFDDTNGALILTQDGFTRSTNAAAQLHLLLVDGGGLIQSENGLEIDSIPNSLLENSSVSLTADGEAGDLTEEVAVLTCGSGLEGFREGVANTTPDGGEFEPREFMGKTVVGLWSFESSAKDIYLVIDGQHTDRWFDTITLENDEEDLVLDYDDASRDEITDGVVTQTRYAWFSVPANDISWTEDGEYNITASLNEISGTSSSVDLGGTLSIIGDEAAGVSTTVENGSFTITVADATDTTKGVASFSEDFTVTDGLVSIAAGGIDVSHLSTSSISLTGSSGSGSVSLGGTLGFSSANGEITATVSGSDIDLSIRDASDTDKGIARFSEANFTVTNGLVRLANPLVLSGVSPEFEMKDVGSGLSETLSTPEELGTTDEDGNGTFTTANVPLPGTILITDQVNLLEDTDGTGSLTGDPAGSATVNYTTGEITVTGLEPNTVITTIYTYLTDSNDDQRWVWKVEDNSLSLLMRTDDGETDNIAFYVDREPGEATANYVEFTLNGADEYFKVSTTGASLTVSSDEFEYGSAVTVGVGATSNGGYLSAASHAGAGITITAGSDADVTITAGSGSTTDADGGNILLAPGAPDGSGDRGRIVLGGTKWGFRQGADINTLELVSTSPSSSSNTILTFIDQFSLPSENKLEVRGLVEFISSVNGSIGFDNQDSNADARRWMLKFGTANTLDIGTANSIGTNIVDSAIKIVRDDTSVASITYGSQASLPTHTFNGDVVHDGGTISTVAVRHFETMLEVETSDETPTEMLKLDGTQLIMNTARVWAFEIDVSGVRSDGSTLGFYKIQGMCSRNDGTTVTVHGTPVVTNIHEDSPDWDVAVSGDTVAGALLVTVTGAESQTVRWSARVRVIETGYSVPI